MNDQGGILLKQFHHILFISTRLHGEKEALKQALLLAQKNETTLDVLIVSRQLPNAIAENQESYELFIKDNANKKIKAAKSSFLVKKKKMEINIAVEWGDVPDITIVQRVIHKGYDLLVKEAEDNENRAGFKALDMALLRKCPCALFIHRSSGHTSPKSNVAVAIDPKNDTPAAHDLSINLLRMSQIIAKYYNSKLNIVSCWDSALEKYLHSHYLVNVPEQQINEVVGRECNEHLQALYGIIKQSGIDEKQKIYQLKGNPVDLIPSFITEQKINILVMGTVARTGIAGFIIGNTAEDILQKIDCSLLALKPPGFVSPVNAY